MKYYLFFKNKVNNIKIFRTKKLKKYIKHLFKNALSLYSTGQLRRNLKYIFNKTFNNIITKMLTHIKLNSRFIKKTKNFNYNKEKIYGIVQPHLNFTNTFIVLTDLYGKIKCWASAGSLGFTYRLRFSPEVPKELSSYVANEVLKQKMLFIKIKFTGPSVKFRSSIYKVLKQKGTYFSGKGKYNNNNSFNIKCIEDGYNKAYNGCRLKRRKRV